MLDRKMTSDWLLWFLKDAAEGVGLGIEKLLEGTGRPVYNRLKELAQYLGRARDGFTLYFSGMEVYAEVSDAEKTMFEDARDLVAECMNQVPEWQGQEPYEQYKTLSYIIMLTDILVDECSGSAWAAKIDLTTAQPKLKADYRALSVFCKNLGARASEMR